MASQLSLVVQQDKKSLKLEETSVPVVQASEILVRNFAVAVNHVDWELLEHGLVGHGQVLGFDFAGTVEKLGSDVKSFKIGDRVAGFVQGGLEDYQGAFQQFVRAQADLVYQIPANLTFEQAATTGLTGVTAALGLRRLFNFPEAPPKNSSILVWGGSTSVGMYAIQLAKNAGLTVIATASKENHDLLKSYGADHLFHISDKDLHSKIRDVVPHGVDFAFDAISDDSIKQVLESVKNNGAVVLVHAVDTSLLNRPDVKLHSFLALQIFNRELNLFGLHFPASEQERTFGSQFYKQFRGLLESGKVHPNPVQLQPNGLAGIADGLKLLKEGKHSASKLVYRVGETPKARKSEQ